MTMYVFRCQDCGPHEGRYPIGTAPNRLSCPDCGEPSTRVITAPGIGRGGDPYRRAVERTMASVDAPQVVSSLPGTNRRPAPVTTDPRHRALPRP